MTAELYAFRRNVVLVASAGTGKTHALVGVLIHALLGVSELKRGPLDPARIAATTFSRKAAAEIRERLVTDLERLAFGAPSPYAPDLAAAASRLGVAWSPDECARSARRALAEIDRASIGTLHGLAYSIARAHAHGAGVSPSLGVASEDEAEAWANEAAIGALHDHAAVDPDGVRDWIGMLRGTERAQSELVRLLLAIEEDGRAADSLALADGDVAALDALMATLAEHARRARADGRTMHAASAFLDAYASGDATTLEATAVDLFTIRRIKNEEAWVTFRDALPGTTNASRAINLVRAWAARGRVTQTAAIARSLLTLAQERLAAIHARAGAIGFSAALRSARDALRDDPAAAARASATYDALLVDEFQDTSRVQVDLVRLLWDRAPASRPAGTMPKLGDLRPTGLLVVGDRKQSIYAFRGADVGVFLATCVELAGETARRALDVPEGTTPVPLHATADFFALRENHRASTALISFVNTFSRECLRAETDDLFEARYVEEIEALLPSARTTRIDERRVTWIRPEGEARDTTRLDDATLLTAYIADAVMSGSADDGTPLAFRDFAVLSQSNEMLDAAAFALSREKIPHVVAGRGFFSAREVQDLILLLRWIERPDDRAALLSVLRGPCAALGDRTLLALTEPHRGLITDLDRWDALDRRSLIEDGDREALDRVKRALRALRSSSERLGPGRTLREAIRELEIEETLLLLPRGVQRIANVRKLLRIADAEPTIRSMLDRVARAEARAREPEAATFSEDDDAVRLLTMHASKGLAFRVVILPELRGSPIRTASTTIGVDLRADPPLLATKVLDDRGEPMMTPSLQDLGRRERARFRADRRRLMYVAVTRARERIVFVGGLKSTTRTEPHFGATVAALAAGSGPIELRESACELAPMSIIARPPTDIELTPPRPPRTTEIAIAPTALQDFHHCARRFELAHLVALPEPTPRALGGFREDGAAATNARAEGDALHGVLERIDTSAFGASGGVDAARSTLRTLGAGLDTPAEERVVLAAARFLESEYARSVRAASAVTWRERAFVVSIASPAMTLTLRGAMDLVVVWPNGDVDVVDYKRARGADLRSHSLQLDVYAYAARELALDHHVRAGAVFLGEEGAEPRFRAPIVPAKLEAHLLELATSIATARHDGRFPRAPEKTCHAIGCGYFTLCHPAKEKRQLTLFQ